MTCRASASTVLVAVVLLAISVVARSPLPPVESDPGRPALPPLALSPDSVCDPGVVWPTAYGVQQTGEINAAFTAAGKFGLRFFYGPWVDSWPSQGFETPAYSGVDYLFTGGLWVGGVVGNDTLVSVTYDGWVNVEEFFPPRLGPEVDRFPAVSDFGLRTSFTDTCASCPSEDPIDSTHRPLDVKVALRSHAWRTPPLDKHIFYDAVITNIGSELIEAGYVGLYVDGDVVWVGSTGEGWTDDLAGAVREVGTAYIIDNNGDFGSGEPEKLRALAARFLNASQSPSDTNCNWWISNGYAELDFGPRLRGAPDDPFRDFGTGGLGTPTGDANKYYVLRHREWDYDQFATAAIDSADPLWLTPPAALAVDLCNGYDARFLLSLGPFTLAPDSSFRVIFSMFTADSIHTVPGNLAHLPADPAAYRDNLGLERLAAGAAAGETALPLLLDPLQAPAWLEVAPGYGHSDLSLEWDPWVYDEVTGYNIYVTPLDPGLLPHPGAVPPWLIPESPVLAGTAGRTYKAVLPCDPGVFAAVNIAHVSAAGAGALSTSEFIHVPSPSAPDVRSMWFVPGEEEAVVHWPAQAGVDRYHVYRGTRYFAPFYSEGRLAASSYGEPFDSVTADGRWYYYYRMAPYLEVPALESSFTETVADSADFLITAVNAYGFESAPRPVKVLRVPVRDKSLMVLTKTASGPGGIFSPTAFCEQFYQAAFRYEIFDYINAADPQWLQLMPYDMVIIDGPFHDGFPSPTGGFPVALERYLKSGGKLVCFSNLGAYYGMGYLTGPGTRALPSSVRSWFGVDSATCTGYGYYYANGIPHVDSIFAFHTAEPIGGGFPSLSCDTAAFPLAANWTTFWPETSPPSVATFTLSSDPSADAVATHVFRSLAPATSLQEGGIVGVKSRVAFFDDTSDVHLFGFHLYHMDTLDARALLAALRTPNSAPALALTGEPGYERKGVVPQWGNPGTAFEFRVEFSDPDGDLPLPGYPRVHLYSALTGGPAVGSPFPMTAVSGARSAGQVYAAVVQDLPPDPSYTYWFEARDEHGAAAAGAVTAAHRFYGPVVTDPGGAVRWVAVTGNDTTGTGDEGAPLASVQRAADLANNGDTIRIGDGVYPGAFLSFWGKQLVIESVHGAAATVIDGGLSPNVIASTKIGVPLAGFEDSTFVLRDLTLRNFGNDTLDGRVLDLNGSSPSIRDCRFEATRGRSAGAVVCRGGSPVFEGCAFIANRADSAGGAVWLDSCEIRFVGCTFAGNAAPLGSAVWASASHVTLERCILAYGQGSPPVAFDPAHPGAVTVSCTDLFGNAGGDWSGCLAGLGTGDNLTRNPQFCDTTGGDYHLFVHSPCRAEMNNCAALIGA
ncbi:MAG TPA: hypothetical protein PKY95_02200, partial [candidate division Zixibacteria bacterium]|nr:hypothetical protein [candidate division Zixibacteria bacterium]